MADVTAMERKIKYIN